MRTQHTVTAETQAAAKLLTGEEVAVGTVLTVTSPKSVAGRECACGCRQTTSGGLWVPGHDAKYKSRMYALVRGTDSEQAKLAKAELTRLGWPMPQGRKAQAPAPLPTA